MKNNGPNMDPWAVHTKVLLLVNHDHLHMYTEFDYQYNLIIKQYRARSIYIVSVYV